MTGQAFPAVAGFTGELFLPAQPVGVVLVIDGSAGAREQMRHRQLVSYLQFRHLAALLLEATPETVPAGDADEGAAIGRLAHAMLRWVHGSRAHAELKGLPIGLYGLGRGGAAALLCAAEQPAHIAAVVSQSAPLARTALELPHMTVPVLLIAPGLDPAILDLTRWAYRTLHADTKRLEVVPRATRLFEEAGAIEQAAVAAAAWFETHLRRPG